MALAPALRDGTASTFPGIGTLDWVAAWRAQTGWLAGQLQAYSCHLSCWAGKVSRLTGASKGSLEVIECCSCPRKGCSKPPMRKSLKTDTGRHLGVILEQELRCLEEAEC